MDHFIARANIRHFGDRLRSEANPGVRFRLQKLLVEEEDKLGQDLELIAEVERTITGFDALIETQSSLVATFERGRSDSLAGARSFLDGLVQSQTLYKDYHRRLVNAVRIHHS
jgi:hypothetical protein